MGLYRHQYCGPLSVIFFVVLANASDTFNTSDTSNTFDTFDTFDTSYTEN